MKRAVLTVAVVALASSMASAQQITIGAHASNYTGFTRGFSYTAPVDHTIVRLELPPERFVAGALASYAIGVNDVEQLYSMGNAGAISGFSVNVLAGDEVIILGNWTDGAPARFTARNSYASGGPDPQFLLGNAVLLYRAGFQWDIGDGTLFFGGLGSAFSGLTGSYGRIFVTVIPAPASLALLGLGGLVAVRRRR